MKFSRRDFMKFVGVSLSGLVLSGCRPRVTVTCYAPLPPSETPLDLKDPRVRIRQCWLSFGELVTETQAASARGKSDDVFGQDLIAKHQGALDELVASGALAPSVAGLVQEAFAAAVYHVWRSNTLITCYEPSIVNFDPVSAQVLVQQADALDQLAALGNIDPQTLENARLALEHDLAFYSLSDDEVNALYQKILADWQGQSVPAFSDVALDVTPDCQVAAQFIIDILIGK
jgi:hypothetical protein